MKASYVKTRDVGRTRISQKDREVWRFEVGDPNGDNVEYSGKRAGGALDIMKILRIAGGKFASDIAEPRSSRG